MDMLVTRSEDIWSVRILGDAPALDLVQTRPSDVGHSEYRGIGKISQQLLFTAILTEKAQEEYLIGFQTSPFPPGWAHIQSTLKHLKSWSMSEVQRPQDIYEGFRPR